MPEPIIIAIAATELILLGPDGRLVRREIGETGDMADALADAWQSEFPEERSGRLLCAAAARGVSRSFCRSLAAAARRAGGRLEAAWVWEDVPENLTVLPEADLAERLAAAAKRPAGGGDDLLARPKFALPPALTGRAARIAGIAVPLLALAALGVLQLRERARRSQRTASAEATLELQAATTAAGLRHRQSIEQAQAVARAAAPERPWQGAFLRALSAATPPAVVVDRLDLSRAGAVVKYHAVAGAPGAETAAAVFRASLVAALEESALKATVASSAPPQTLVLNVDGIAPVEQHSPAAVTAETAQADADAAVERLPDRHRFEALLRECAAQWRVRRPSRSEADLAWSFSEERCTFVPPNLGRGAWPLLLALATRLAAVPGCTIEACACVGDGAESGAFGAMSLTATLRCRKAGD